MVYATISWPTTPDGETAWWTVGTFLNVFTIDSWNVWIGKTPSTKLDVNWTLTATNIAWTLTTASQPNITSLWTISSLTATNIAWTLTTASQPNITSLWSQSTLIVTWNATFDTNTLFVDSTNHRVWIWTLTPWVDLDVKDTDLSHIRAIITGQTNNPSIYMLADESNNKWWLYSTAPKLELGANNSIHMTIDTTWKVGIGTSSPTEKLEVEWAINIGSTTNTTAGNLRWSWADFEWYNGTLWKSLTSAGADTWPPIWSVMAFALDSCPAWWSMADGSNWWTYKPDLRWRFVRWIDSTGTNDSVRAVANAQSDSMQGHKHRPDSGTFLTGYGSPIYADMFSGGSVDFSYSTATTGPVSDGTNWTPRTGSETRPKNVALTYCIKITEGAGTSLWNINWSDINFTSGNVGIGTTTPTSKIHVETNSWTGDSKFLANITNLTPQGSLSQGLLVRWWGNDNDRSIFEVQDFDGNIDFKISGNGKVGIGTSTPWERLEVDWNANINWILKTKSLHARYYLNGPGDHYYPANGDEVNIWTEVENPNNIYALINNTDIKPNIPGYYRVNSRMNAIGWSNGGGFELWKNVDNVDSYVAMGWNLNGANHVTHTVTSYPIYLDWTDDYVFVKTLAYGAHFYYGETSSWLAIEYVWN